MPEAPPALAARPEFTAKYWSKVPRALTKATIQRVTNLPKGNDDDDQYVEIVVDNGVAFRRRKADIAQLLTANMKVSVENIMGEVVTGLHVPEIGWAWRMSNEDLAQYAQDLATHQHIQAQRAKAEIGNIVCGAIVNNLQEQAEVEFVDEKCVAVTGPIDTHLLTATVLATLEAIGRTHAQ